MKMVSLELPKKKDKGEECCEAVPCGENEKYPWGMQLRFEKEQVDLFPELKDVSVGDKVMVMCEACVTEISMTEGRHGESRHTVGMQIQEMCVQPKVEKTLKEMTLKEYSALRKAGMGDSSGSKELVI